MNIHPIKSEAPQCLDGFDHINRYWDPRHKHFFAKILPGEFYVSTHPEMIATTLGSCVSACIWDAHAAIGGMNHFMLPLTEKQSHEVQWGNMPSDATRYGNYAMEHMINVILTHGGQRRHLQAKVFGGGKVMKALSDVGKKNSEFVLEYMEAEKIPVLAADLGDIYPRKLMFDPLSGAAKMKKLRSLHNDTIASRETNYRKSIVHKPVDGDIELF